MWLTIHHFLHALFGKNYRKFTRRQHVAIFRPRLEVLEDRTVPSTLTVTNNLDDGSAGSLRAAVLQADTDAANGRSDTINFASSLAGATIILTQGQLELSGASGSTITIDGSGLSTPVTISGHNASRVFQVDAGTTAAISDLTISGGNATNDGGGIYNEGSLTVSDSTLSGNSASAEGGGIYNNGNLTVSDGTLSDNYSAIYGGGIFNDSFGSLTVSGSTLSGNSASSGGGIYNDGGSLTVSDSTLSVNSADDGGGIFNQGNLTVRDSTLSGNSASNGGGIFNNVGSLTVSDSTLSGNSASGADGSHGYGGGIFNGASLTVSGSTLSGNTASGDSLSSGGGIFNGASLTVSDSTLSGNAAPSGGGIYNGGNLTVSDSTLSGNSANQGGGIYNDSSTSPVTLTNVTLADNQASSSGGGFYIVSGTPVLHNTLIADNLVGSTNSDVSGALDPTSDYNLIGDGTGMTGISNGDANHNQVGSVTNPINPLLAPLGNYGGPTQTMALLPGSPAIDQGSSAYGGSSDQRGQGRVGATDIGAFEAQPVTFTVTNTNDSGAGSLRQAILDANTFPAGGGTNIITFDIPTSDPSYHSDPVSGASWFTIQPLTALPAITAPVIINGYSQPGATPNTLAVGDNAVIKIDLDGSQAGLVDGLDIGNNSTVEGLAVTNFGHATPPSFTAPVAISAGGNNQIIGDFIGTDVTGTVEEGNGMGVVVYGADNTIGGTDPTMRNIIGGNTTFGVWLRDNGNMVEGNYIGTDITGTKAFGNSVGVQDDWSNTIGGSASGAGNVISGNRLDGIRSGNTASDVIQDNFIGTDATGKVGLGNGLAPPPGVSPGAGIEIDLGSATITGNVISANPNGITSNGSVVVQGNLIGTDVTGTKALGNTITGIVANAPGLIGGPNTADRNIISGNATGITAAPGVVIHGNYIGTDITGTQALGNDGGSSNNDVGDNGGIELFGGGTTIVGNLISGNGAGIDIRGGSAGGREDGSGTVIQGNLIGTDYTGKQPLGNAVGIYFQSGGSNYTIGGLTLGAGNVISGNGRGISMVNDGPPVSTGDVIEGNFIGTNAAGATNLGNGTGVYIEGYYSDTQIGGTTAAAANVIADNGTGVFLNGSNGNVIQGNSIIGNGGNGVYLQGALNTMVGGTTTGAGNTIASNAGSGVNMYAGAGNSVLGNSIHDNASLGIFLASGANDNQAAPVLTSASSSSSGTTVSGTLTSVANTTFRIEFFANQSPNPSGYGEGQTYLGFATVTTDGNGNATFTATGLALVPAGQASLSATATNLTTNDTSGFSKDGELALATLTSSAPSSVFGQPVTFTATLGAFAGSGTPTGSVDFVDTTTNTDLGSVPLSGGTATLTTSGLGVGTHAIQAVYGGDGTFLGTSATLMQTVNQDATTTALSSTVNPSTYGQGVTFTATASPTAPGSGTPTGSVDFFDTSTNTDLGSVALSGGVATLNVSTLTAGSHAITATYSGDSNFLTSTSPADTQMVHPAATTTSTVSLSSSSAVYGQPVTLTATVTNTQSSASPSGSVGFYAGSTELGTATVGAGGIATLTVSTLSLGKHSLTASFSDPANNFAPSSSPAGASLTIGQASSATSLTATTNSPVFGQSVTFTATVTAVAPSGATPAGTVAFMDGNTVLKKVSLSGGSASYTTSALAVGGHSVTASYLGNSDFGTSTSTAYPVTVGQDGTTAAVVVTSPATTPVYGQSVTLKATVTALAPGSGTRTGETVTFYDGTVLLGSATLNSSGVATLKTSALDVGPNSITVFYGGDGNFLSSTSPALAVTVNQDSTKTVLTSSSQPGTAGQPVTFTATVSPAGAGSGTPTGSVTFWLGSTQLGTASLSSSGVAILSHTFTATGKYKITAVYSGDGNFLTSTSSVLTETIN